MKVRFYTSVVNVIHIPRETELIDVDYGNQNYLNYATSIKSIFSVGIFFLGDL